MGINSWYIASVNVKIKGATKERQKGATQEGGKNDVKDGNLSFLIIEIKRLANDRYRNVYNNINLA